MSQRGREGERRCGGAYLSMLKAHRLSTVMPTEAFWMKGTSLHRVTPNGQSSARSCTNTQRSCHSLVPFILSPAALLWGRFLLFFLLLLRLPFSCRHVNPERCSSRCSSSEHETFSLSGWNVSTDQPGSYVAPRLSPHQAASSLVEPLCARA